MNEQEERSGDDPLKVSDYKWILLFAFCALLAWMVVVYLLESGRDLMGT